MMPADIPLGALRELEGLWLRVRCTCGRSADFSAELLARRHGPDALIENLVPRLRCSSCGSPPAELLLTENPQWSAKGYATSF